MDVGRGVSLEEGLSHLWAAGVVGADEHDYFIAPPL